ncbi:MAG: hypothetical protein NHB32_30490 [Fischerella sp. CENA71]|nr:hypothetical protein [Fischerella sp. CENA71]
MDATKTPKITGNSNSDSKSVAPATVSSPAVVTNSNGNISVAAPGLPDLRPEGIAALTPRFELSQYHVDDPLNPPESLPQATQSQFDKGMTIYEGASRALKLTGAAMDLTKEKFTVLKKKASAVGAGIQAATEIEKVKGDYLGYLSQSEITQQKGTGYVVEQARTQVIQQTATYTQVELQEKLKQAEIKSQDAQYKTIQAQGKLNEFKNQLGEYLPQGK